ncbi:oxidative stress defense protein [Vibrio mangrovi]|uniref:26 kDa periplasmic immunogenic protein n=1 Tax=Vibrio mangrovi TaxID=474394 RepID=A0A1Y6IU97_9VIBR|nr:oxidative stress defense protein [Vibrio mangrovi]MDW6001910.1 oxidative stress defense protein [Vibrio mangrovi]SMS00062.1 26 kDa periplasmic immunogenic protein precursor [Vibrio mangrovi]
MRFMILSLMMFCLHTYAAEVNFPHISVTGFGEVTVVPDSAVFSVQVEQSTLNAEQAKESVDTVVRKFSERLQELGAEDEQISSSNLSLAPQYHYPDEGKPELVGYRASRSVTVSVKHLEKLNEFLDVALESGINRIDRITLQVKDHRKYQAQARDKAIQDASMKALSIAKGFKRSLGPVWRVDYHSQQSKPMMMRSVSMNQKESFQDYQDKTIVISDSVDVLYRLN